MKSIARASACCAAALLFALPLASPSARADGNDTALTNLIALAAQRLALAEPAAEWKWQHRKPFSDASREAAVLHNAARRASMAGVDPGFARAFFRDQIDASRRVQEALFDTWRESEAPSAPAPDLATVTRPQADRLTGPLVTALARVEPMRAEPDCPIRVARALANWKDLTRYDSARTDAMNRALGHVCEAGGVGSVA